MAIAYGDESVSPRIFMLQAEGAAVYVVQSQNVRECCETLLKNANWSKLNVDSIDLIAQPDADQRKLIQAALVQKEHAFLNCRRKPRDYQPGQRCSQ